MLQNEGKTDDPWMFLPIFQLLEMSGLNIPEISHNSEKLVVFQ